MTDSTRPDPFGPPISAGGRVARLAGAADMPGVLDLRAAAFRQGRDDRDDFDSDSLHLWVGRPAGPVEATLRVRRHRDATGLLQGYAASLYDLGAMARLGGETLELGRLCTQGGDGDLLRLLWAGVARLALVTGAARLIGCTSFHTTDAGSLGPAWALLAARHQGPADRRPAAKAPETLSFDTVQASADPEAAALLPGLLRAYLAMGVVIDRDLGTCHVFTCVEIDRMPEARRRALQRLASG